MLPSTPWIGSTLHSDEDNLYLVHRISNMSSTTYGFFVVSIPKNQIFETACRNSSCENLLILDHREQPLFSYHQQDQNESLDFSHFLAEYAEQIDIAPETAYYFNARIDGKRWITSAYGSENSGMIYLSFMPYDKFQLEQTFFTGMLIIITLSIAAAAIISIWAFTTRMYRPLGALVSRVNTGENEGTDDEFEVLSNYIDSISGSNRFMKNMLEEQQGQVKQLFFSNLFSQQLSVQQIEERCKTLSVPLRHRWYALAMFRIENTERSSFRTLDTDLILFAVKNISDELLSHQSICCSEIKENAFLLLYQTASGNPEEAKAEIQQSLGQLLDMVQKNLFVQLTAGVSSFYETLTDTGQALDQAEKALKYRGGDDSAIEYYDTIENAILPHYQFPQQALDGILAGLRQSDEKKIRTNLHSYIESHFTQSASYPEFEYAMARLMTGVMEYLQTQQLGGSPLSQMKLPEISGLLSLGYSRETETWLMSQLFLPVLHETKRDEKSSLASQVTDIIRQEYDTPLTLEYCAAKVGYHPSHVSRIFSQQMGCSFKEYLYLYRIEQAKRMLVQTEMKIQDISNRLCYNNPQNFIRVFKKVEGVTPGEYRQKFKN